VLFDDYHGFLVKRVLHVAGQRHLQASVEDKQTLKEALKSAAAYGAYLLDHSPFRREVKGAAADTANSARRQTAKALGKPVDTSLAKQEHSLFVSTDDKAQEKMDESIERAESIYDEWDELSEDSEDYEDEEALAARLDEGLSGLSGAVLAAASLYFGYEFGQMIQEAQTDSGVSEYVWLSMRDSHTRPEHQALDGEVAAWDDPPLKAEDSDNGEDDHPGEDFNCRCVASPIDPEGLDEKQQERVDN
jgi:SPP1 gp7 family putative phage head morphogenesis protein